MDATGRQCRSDDYDAFYVRERSNMRTGHLDIEQNKMVTVHVLTMALKKLDKIRYKMLQRRRPVDRDTELTTPRLDKNNDRI